MEHVFHNDDAGLDWLFAQARRYPLLDAHEETEFDQRKWRAITDLQTLYLADDATRAYLCRWTRQLLDAPPHARNIAQRQHAQLLRRELADYLPDKALHAELRALHAALQTSRDEDARSALASLQLPAALVAGMGELLSGEREPRGVAAALLAWQATWEPTSTPASVAADTTRQGIRQKLRDYRSARSKLVNHNLRLVFSIAGRMNTRSVSFRDLVQEGVFGLMRAAEKYETSRGYRFSTYAYNWITQSMRRALADQEGIVRLPTQVMEQVGKLHRERMHHIDKTGEEPGARILAERLDVPLAELEELRVIGNLGLSLETPHTADADEGMNLGATLAGGPFDAAADEAQRVSLQRTLMQRLQQLKPAERSVIVNRWGLEDRQSLSRAEIGLQMGVSAERVRQLEVAALQKLRHDPQLFSTYRDQMEGAE
ncbi:MAG: sigma-70 family RNA polymerase sigma factor [Halioglobus sp.]|nr:sigma-70 family RNA polymerase sigma factor [Halioglobus sp.]